MTGFRGIAPGVHVLRHPALDVNVALVVGADRALLVDTLSGPAQAEELHDRVRAVTDLPLTLVNTHHHFDHCFGNDTLLRRGAGPAWAHEWTAGQLRVYGGRWQREWYEQWLPQDPQVAAELRSATVTAPERVVHRDARIDLGDRQVTLRHTGRGHTAGDLAVWVPDAGVLVAGDLLEEAGPPDFADAFPLDWPQTLGTLLADLPEDTSVVPGHGSVVDLAFAWSQQTQLAELARLISAGDEAGADAEEVAAEAPFGPAAALAAVHRAYVQLSGVG